MIVKTLSSQFLANRRSAAIAEYERILKKEMWDARDQVMIYEGNLASVSMKPPAQDDKRFWYEELDKLRVALEYLKKRHADTVVAMEGDMYAKPAFRHFLRVWEEQHLPAESDFVDVEVKGAKQYVPRAEVVEVPTVVEIEPEVPTVVEVEPEVRPPKGPEAEMEPEVSIEESVVVEPTPEIVEADVKSDEIGHDDQTEKRVDTVEETGDDAQNIPTTLPETRDA
jgi:hypothetical protein